MIEPAPDVTVLMPMRNAAPYVEQALRSILEERTVPLEVVVIDDGSTDGSAKLAQAIGDPRVRIVNGPQQGIAAAFNAGLMSTRAAIVMRCDADDLYPPGRIAHQIDWLRRHPEFGAICGAFAAMDSRGGSRLPFRMAVDASEITDELRNGVTRTHYCTFGVRTAVLQELGGARPFFVTAEDVDLQLRLGEACRVWYSPEAAYVYRIHDSSITHRIRAAEREYFDQCAHLFQAQRRSRGSDDLQLGNPPQRDNLEGKASSARLHMQGLLIAGSWSAYGDAQYGLAIRYALQGALAKPASLGGWRNLAIVLIRAGLAGSARLRSKASS